MNKKFLSIISLLALVVSGCSLANNEGTSGQTTTATTGTSSPSNPSSSSTSGGEQPEPFDTTTIIYEPNKKTGIKSSISIDLFILDNIPNNKAIVKKIFFKEF